MKLRSYLFCMVAIFTVLFGVPSTGFAKSLPNKTFQAGQNPLLCITSAPNVTAFPSITLNFRMLNASMLPITPVDTELRFSENGQPSLPVGGGIQKNPNDAGIDYYIIVDKGNRSSQDSVRGILQIFANSGYYNEQTDKVKIYTNQGNLSQVYYPGGTSGNSLAEAIANFPVNGDKTYRQVSQSLDSVLSEIEANPDPCQNMRVILMIMGDQALFQNEVLSFSQRTKTSLAKLAVFHLNGAFESRDVYSDLATQSGGIYRQIKSLDNDVKPGLDELILYKQVYSATYRTNYGQTGTHNISATYQNQNIPVFGLSSYPVDVRPPTVALVGETVINRSAQSKTVTGEYVYDGESLPYVLQIDWTDTFPRNIKSAVMVVKEGETENETVVQLTPKSENTYEINWNFSPIKTSGAHTLYLSAKIIDEFDFQGTSTPLEILLTNNTELADKVPTWVPTALIILGSVVVVLLLLMVFMWRRMLSFAKQGGALLGKIAGEIRKTIVGGGKRGKPLASLKVLDGPPAMIGQELKIYTESVKMGRNPQLADMTFYGPDINTSVSGLHARLEKMSRSWRIVALSQSGSETFVDDQSIPFNEPVSLTSGQKIRMGYFAQQPVILEFSTEQAQSDSQYPKATPEDNDVRKTELLSNEMEDKAGPNIFFGRPNSMPPQSAAKKPTTQDSDSVFDDLRD